MSIMQNKLWGAIPLIAGTSMLLGANPLMAQSLEETNQTSQAMTLEQLRVYGKQLRAEGSPRHANAMGQLTSVDQLRDVSPGEWAYEALRNLVENYGCIVGYPDLTYRGTRSLSRWEFAAGLNACLTYMERLIQENVALLREDIDLLKRLAKEFEAELAALGARVDNLESRVAFLEDHQFSTTTKLVGEVVFGLYGIATGQRDSLDPDERRSGNDVDNVPAFGHRTRLEFNTSFTGEDLLFTRLSTGTIASLQEQTLTFQSELSFAQPDDNDIAIDVLLYEFPVGDNASVVILAAGGATDDYTDTYNILDGDGGAGAVSLFGTRNPIYEQASETGIGFRGQWGIFELSAGYLAAEGSDPSAGSGLFNGPYSATAQVGIKTEDDKFGASLLYVHGFNTLDTGSGSTRSNFQFFTEDVFGEAIPVVSDSYGLQFTWRASDKFTLGGWGAYTKATTLSTLGITNRGSLDIWNWAVTFAFPDLFKEGSTGGIIVGMQPWVTDSSVSIPGLREEDDDTSFHIEAFYELALTDNINITPGIIVVTSPDNNSDNDALVIGTIRTTFNF